MSDLSKREIQRRAFNKNTSLKVFHCASMVDDTLTIEITREGNVNIQCTEEGEAATVSLSLESLHRYVNTLQEVKEMCQELVLENKLKGE